MPDVNMGDDVQRRILDEHRWMDARIQAVKLAIEAGASPHEVVVVAKEIRDFLTAEFTPLPQPAKEAA
jgi:hypothetical protein